MDVLSFPGKLYLRHLSSDQPKILSFSPAFKVIQNRNEKSSLAIVGHHMLFKVPFEYRNSIKLRFNRFSIPPKIYCAQGPEIKIAMTKITALNPGDTHEDCMKHHRYHQKNGASDFRSEVEKSIFEKFAFTAPNAIAAEGA